MPPGKFLNSWISERAFPAFRGCHSRILGCGGEPDSKASIGVKLERIFEITFLNYAISH